jgi:hypothetical protein
MRAAPPASALRVKEMTQPRSLSDFEGGFGPKGLGNSAQAFSLGGVIFTR